MIKSIKFIALVAALLVILGADISAALLQSSIILSNQSGSAQTQVVIPIELSTQGMIDTGQLSSTALNMELCDTDPTCSVDEIPYGPSPLNARIEFHRQFNVTGSAFTDDTAAIQDDTANDVTIFDANPEVGDLFYTGFDIPGRIMRLNIGTAGVGVWTITWEYFNGSWVSLDNVEDSTVGFHQPGNRFVQYTMPVDWTTTAIDGSTAYWIRGNLSAFTSSSTSPIGTQGFFDVGLWYAYIESMSDGGQELANLYTGGAAIRTTHKYFPGDDGVVIPEDTTGLNAINASDWSLEIIGSFDPNSTGSARKLLDSSGSAGTFMDWDASIDGQLDIEFEFSTGDDCDLSNTATGITDGTEATILITLNAANTCEVFVDTVSKGTDATAASLLDWDILTIGADGSMSYINSIKSSTDEDPDTSTIIHYEPNTIVGYTAIAMPDRATGVGDDDDLIPTFPIPVAGISSSVGAFASTSTPPVADSSQDDPSVIHVNPGSSVTFTGTPVVGVDVPLGDTIKGILEPINVPVSFWWHILIAMGTIASILIVATITRGNLIAGVVAGGVVLTLFTSPLIGLISWWVVFVYIVFAVGTLLLAKGREVGV